MCKVLAARRCIGKNPSMSFLGKERSAVVHYPKTIYSICIYIHVCVCVLHCMSMYVVFTPVFYTKAYFTKFAHFNRTGSCNRMWQTLTPTWLHDIIQQLRQLRGGAFWELREEREDLGFDSTAYFDVFCMFHSAVVFPEVLVLWSPFWRLSMLSWVKIAEAEEEKKKAQDADGRRMQWFCRWTRVDGRNPAPVDMVNIPVFTGFHTSQVLQHFFHQ